MNYLVSIIKYSQYNFKKLEKIEFIYDKYDILFIIF